MRNFTFLLLLLFSCDSLTGKEEPIKIDEKYRSFMNQCSITLKNKEIDPIGVGIEKFDPTGNLYRGTKLQDLPGSKGSLPLKNK
ncbi:MAG: hypothetical protein NE334_06595 [Lentisphaeraceae bacterium]|nr:hypothetical protein [Lentisphaeraceae bacterium]